MIHYKYQCTTRSGVRVQGTMTWHSPFDRDQIMNAIFNECSTFVISIGHPWDPFNVELIVSAQNEPKP